MTPTRSITRRASPALALALASALLGACGGSSKSSTAKSSTAQQSREGAVAKFVACMRSYGVNYPAPNTSGNGPLFDLSKVDTTSARYKAAQKVCLPQLSRSIVGLSP